MSDLAETLIEDIVIEEVKELEHEIETGVISITQVVLFAALGIFAFWWWRI